MPFKAVAFDLDGTLLVEKSSWYKLHEYFGTKEQSIHHMKLYEKGQITYAEFMRLDIGLWNPRPHISIIESVLESYHLTPNSKLVINILKQKGYSLFIVTTAPSILATKVAIELDISYVASNEFVFDENGYLKQNAVFNVDLMKKDQAFDRLLKKVGLDCKDCIAVGDTKYDLPFLNRAGLGIAFQPDEILRGKAEFIIDDMRELLPFIC